MLQLVTSAYKFGPIEDWSHRARGTVISSGRHGYLALSTFLEMRDDDAELWRTRRGAVLVKLNDGPTAIWRGRLEDVAIVPGGLRIRALGEFQAYSDVPYTALWSDTQYAAWEPVTADDSAGDVPERWEMDNNNRLYIAPRQPEGYANAGDYGDLTYVIPDASERNIVGFSYKYEVLLPTNWRGQIIRCNEDFSSQSVVRTFTGTGALQSGAELQTFTGSPRLLVRCYNNTGGLVSVSWDTGTDAYVKLTEIRVVTSSTNMVNTTLGTTIAAGTRTVTPAAMTNIFVGQKLIIGGSGVSEMVTVTAVTATQFTAVFANAHNLADSVQAFFIPADEIAGALATYVDGINANQVATGTFLIQSPGHDLTDELYQDEYPADILVRLAERENYEVGVWDDQLLFFKPRSYGRRAVPRTWYVDADVELERTLEAVANSAYAVYQDARGRVQRTATSTDSDSKEQWGITRRVAVPVDSTTVGVLAESFRDDYLEEHADPTPRAVLTFDRVFDGYGNPAPLYLVHAGDRMVARNRPGRPTFDLASVEYDVDGDYLSVEPLVTEPTIARFLAANTVEMRKQRNVPQKPRVL